MSIKGLVYTVNACQRISGLEYTFSAIFVFAEIDYLGYRLLGNITRILAKMKKIQTRLISLI